MRSIAAVCLSLAVLFCLCIAFMRWGGLSKSPQSSSLPSELSQGGTSADSLELEVWDPRVLSIVERQGADFASQLEGREVPASNLAALSKEPLYASLYSWIVEILRAHREQVAESKVQRSRPVHWYNPNWLISSGARFDLIGIVNRFDRHINFPDTCGEVRFIYRHAYSLQRRSAAGDVEEASQLPMTLSFLYPLLKKNGETDCRRVAAAARMPGRLSPEQSARYLLRDGSPYRAPIMLEQRVAGVELNFQINFWPPVENTDYLEQAKYLLRSFIVDHSGQKLVAQKLLNTPYVELIRNSSELKAGLLAWLKDPATLEAIDRGSAKIPDRFLAEEAILVTPFSMQRVSSLLFSQLFSPDDFSLLDLTRYRQVRTPASLLRRLDSSTCAGCHASRSAAGFHFVGLERNLNSGFNSVAVPFSTHFSEIREWRRNYLSSYLKNPVEPSYVPFAERSSLGPGGFGAHCGLGDAGFAEWTCKEGYRCFDTYPVSAQNHIGQCFPDHITPAFPCEESVLTSYEESTQDILTLTRILTCPGEGMPIIPRHGCNQLMASGFPNGNCRHSCTRDSVAADDICMLVPFGTDFKRCEKLPGVTTRECFSSVMKHPIVARRCSVNVPCQDDYFCTGQGDQTESEDPRDRQGACSPLYLLPQFRINRTPTELSSYL